MYFWDKCFWLIFVLFIGLLFGITLLVIMKRWNTCITCSTFHFTFLYHKILVETKQGKSDNHCGVGVQKKITIYRGKSHLGQKANIFYSLSIHRLFDVLYMCPFPFFTKLQEWETINAFFTFLMFSYCFAFTESNLISDWSFLILLPRRFLLSY